MVFGGRFVVIEYKKNSYTRTALIAVNLYS